MCTHERWHPLSRPDKRRFFDSIVPSFLVVGFFWLMVLFLNLPQCHGSWALGMGNIITWSMGVGPVVEKWIILPVFLILTFPYFLTLIDSLIHNFGAILR
jgi:hypothetical protein